jgi:hypothetical protein
MIFTASQRQRTAEGFSIYWVAILKAALLTSQAMVGVYLAGTMKWTTMDIDDRLMLFAGMFMAGSSAILSFLDRSLSRIDAEQKQKTLTNQGNSASG